MSSICDSCDKPRVTPELLNLRLKYFLEGVLDNKHIPSKFLITGSWALRYHLDKLGIPHSLVPKDFDLFIDDDHLRKSKGHVVGKINSGVSTFVGTESVDLVSPEMVGMKGSDVFVFNRLTSKSDSYMIDLVSLVSLYDRGLEDELDDEKREIREALISKIKETDEYKDKKRVYTSSKELGRDNKPNRGRRRKAISFSLGDSDDDDDDKSGGDKDEGGNYDSPPPTRRGRLMF
jgi:hypothetical protein